MKKLIMSALIIFLLVLPITASAGVANPSYDSDFSRLQFKMTFVPTGTEKIIFTLYRNKAVYGQPITLNSKKPINFNLNCGGEFVVQYLNASNNELRRDHWGTEKFINDSKCNQTSWMQQVQ